MSGPLLSLEPPSGAAIRTSRLVWILLACVLLWSLALRVWFATPYPDPSRFWDERYGLENITALLQGHTLRPANGFHPSLSYLPQAGVLWASEGLHRVTGSELFAVFGPRPGSQFTPTAYLLCRLTQVLFGGLSLWLVFLIGRRLAGSRVGLLAAFLLAVVPWHIRQSVIYKPDILLVLTVLAAFLLTLRAVDRPTLGRYLAAGAGIGLALASKFNAGPIAIPLTLGALAQVRQNKRALLWLVAAGGVSLALFLLLNPYALIEPEIFRRSFGRTLRDYAWKGARRGGDSRLYLLWHAASSLLSGSFHGPFIGALALAALVLVTILGLRRLGSSRHALPWLLAVAYVVAYVAFYAAATTNPSAHNWLTLTPFLALTAAWLLARLAERLTTAWPRLGRAAPAAVACGLLALAVAWPAQSYVYREVVPTTGHLAGNWLRPRVRRAGGRLIYSESALGARALKRGNRRVPLALLERLDALRPRVLNYADAEIFLADRLREPEAADFYRRRMERMPPHNVNRVRPGLFRARGPALIVIAHPLRRHRAVGAEWVRTTEDGLYELRVPEIIPPRSLASVEFALPAARLRDQPVELFEDGESYVAVPVQSNRRTILFASRRFRAGQGLRLRLPARLSEDHLPVVLRSWGQRRFKAKATRTGTGSESTLQDR